VRKTGKVQEDADLCRLPGLQACRSACAISLGVDGEHGALLLLAHPEADFFSEERGEALSLVARQAATAIRQSNLLNKAISDKEHILELEEEARRQMARDLHDGPTQSIAALAMRVNFARRMLDRDAKAAVEELAKVEELARDITKEMRHLLFVLRPLVLESHGLAAALDALADKYYEAYQFSLENSVELDLLSNLPMDRQAALFYIIEEAINRARKQAGASQAWVHLGKQRLEGRAAEPLEAGHFILEIEDNGDPPAGDGSERISGMLRERATLTGASLSLQAREGGGAHLSLVAPLAAPAGPPPA
jgi:signal transduction histidine kinase